MLAAFSDAKLFFIASRALRHRGEVGLNYDIRLANLQEVLIEKGSSVVDFQFQTYLIGEIMPMDSRVSSSAILIKLIRLDVLIAASTRCTSFDTGGH